MKNYLVLKYHILVSLLHLCILLNILTQIFIFLSIYKLGTIPLEPKDIGMVLSIYCVTFKEQLIYACFIQKNQSNNYLDILMQDTFQIHIKLDHRQGMFLIIMELLFNGYPLSRQW